MTSPLGRRVLLGISAGIAAYKSAHLVRLLKKAGCEIRVVMTEGAQAFITPLTLQALTGEVVRTSLLDPEAEAGMGHIELARWAEIILIAPATADLMARLAQGQADDLLTTLCLASDARCAMAPAMNQAMWRHVATRRNTQRLQEDGWQLLGPDAGDQACGDVGPGRMLEPEAIVDELFHEPETTLPARGLTITLTAGPTREPLDPVRYLSNHSSGKMGYALAQAAVDLGATVKLISGPVTLSAPQGVERIDVETAQEMRDTATRLARQSDIFIGCAAVADYRAETVSKHKIKKTDDQEGLTLKLVKNPDIIAEIGAMQEKRPYVVGFAAETRELETYARDKLERKALDMIVANDVSQQGLGFGSDHNAVLLLWRDDGEIDQRFLPTATKHQLAQTILATILEHLPSQGLASQRLSSQRPSSPTGTLHD